MMYVTTAVEVEASPETVFAVYADHRLWPWLFPTIRSVRLVRREGRTVVLEIDHEEGRVLNRMTLFPPDELLLWEEKRRYDALFVNRFSAIPGGTLFTVTGFIWLTGPARWLRPFLGGVVRRRMRRLQLQPVKAAAEERSGRVRSREALVRLLRDRSGA
ncbi:MAG TPA: SRPBCC family protein [Mycobacteriales bacterium]